MRTCTIDGCDRKYESNGMCHTHYQRTRPRTPDKPKTVDCVVCGTTVQRMPGGYKPKYGHTCSNTCRKIVTFGERCELPADHWARWYGATSKWEAPRQESTRPAFFCNTCNECGDTFVEHAYGVPSTYCSTACAKRVARRTRRAREHNAPGTYTRRQLIAQFIKQGLTCAYCKGGVAGVPDPEHVTPLSRGGRNDMTNIVAACRPCNADKNDLTLTEWAADRARRNLPPVDVTLTGTAYRHLWITDPTSPAWRDRTDVLTKAA